MKKVLVFLLCLVLLFATVSCNKKKSEEVENTTITTSITEPAKMTTIDATDDIVATEPQATVPQDPAVVLPEAEQVLFDGDYSEFEFYLGEVHVFGQIDNSKVVFNYDSNYFDQNIETELVQIASTVDSFKTDEIKYTVSKSQLVFYYTDKIDPNKAMDTFFDVVFSLD